VFRRQFDNPASVGHQKGTRVRYEGLVSSAFCPVECILKIFGSFRPKKSELQPQSFGRDLSVLEPLLSNLRATSRDKRYLRDLGNYFLQEFQSFPI